MPYRKSAKKMNDIEAASDTIIDSNSFFDRASRNINAKTGISFNLQKDENENFENSIEKRK